MVDGGGDDDGYPLAFCHQLSHMTKCKRRQFDPDEKGLSAQGTCNRAPSLKYLEFLGSSIQLKRMAEIFSNAL